MSHTVLHDLCAGFCAIANVAIPELREQEDGIVAFSVLWQEVAVDVMARPAADPGHVFLLFDLGAPDPLRADPSRVLLALMHTNFMALRTNPPVFSCHPETNRVLLQWPVALQGMTPALLQQVIQEGVTLARLWREDYFLPEATAGVAAIAPPAGAYA